MHARLVLLALLLAVSSPSQAHPGHVEPDPEAVVDAVGPQIEGRIDQWTFDPGYALPRDAQLEATAAVPTDVAITRRLSSPRLLVGQEPTERERDLLEADALPAGDFTLELWATYHVNETIGAAVHAFDADTGDLPHWLLGFMGGTVYFSVGDAQIVEPQLEIKGAVDAQDLDSGEFARGAERYWHHLVGVRRGGALTLFHNGVEIAEGRASALPTRYAAATEFELSAYLGNEPHMTLGNLVRYAAIYDRALSQQEIEAAFVGHRELVEHGVHARGRFHFTTGGPHLAVPTTEDVHLTWEADRPHAAVVEWGDSPELGQRLVLPADDSRMKTARIAGLDANRAYYYRVTATDRAGAVLDSGLQLFRTAIERGEPFTFAAISDTEARPHVNAKIAELVWRESPHFLINAGDLTDGGRHDHRVEWTHEYFAAMAPLMARMPVVPVMGNGENDFVWFDRYHYTPGDGISYYRYAYGDVDLFVLDSNLDRRDREDPEFRARQRAWFEQALRSSTARWKIATHHHPVLDRYPQVISDFVDLYQQYDVDLVLVGHHHNYLRSWPLTDDVPDLEDGIVYVQLGGGGGNLSGRPSTPDLRWAKTYQGYGYSLFSVAGDRLYVRMHDDDGAMRDSFTLLKDGDRRARMAPAVP